MKHNNGRPRHPAGTVAHPPCPGCGIAMTQTRLPSPHAAPVQGRLYRCPQCGLVKLPIRRRRPHIRK